jgi:glucose-6-phosphate 1-dehydrogenase
MDTLESSLLAETESKRQQRPSCVFVLFGATGDLAARRIVPALYNLAVDGLLGEDFAVLGVARRAKTDQQFRDEMFEAIQKYSRQKPDPEFWRKLSRSWHYFQLQAGDDEGYRNLGARLGEMDAQHRTCGCRLFYLAMTPDTFSDIIDNLGKAGLSHASGQCAFARIVVEKPFGHDLASARALNELLRRHFEEAQVFRIDHYLGKETVMNLLALRFANRIIEPLLNAQHVDHVQITVAETVGMEGRRGPYYEQAGALRDMVQNHLLQLLALVAMEVPQRLSAEDIRGEKVKVLRAVEPLTPQQVARQTVRGQYGRGLDTPGYRHEEGVSPSSQMETFVAMKLCVENWRWAGVPFYLRTGKELAAKASRVVIVFRREPTRLFTRGECEFRSPNRLVIRIHPDEGIAWIVDGKVPGPDMMLRPIKMNFQYGSSFEWASPEAYEHLLLDAMLGEATLFIRDDEVEASWRLIDPIRQAWVATGQPPLIEYAPLTWGPRQSQELLGDAYQSWYD